MLKNKVIKYKKLYQLSLIFLLLFLPLLLLALIRETNIRSNAFSSSLETENGSLSGNASVQTDPLASGGKYVEFGKTALTPRTFPVVGDLPEMTPQGKNILIRYFSSLVLPVFMITSEPQKGVFNFTQSDEDMRFAKEHNMVVHGTPLIWNWLNPDWLTKNTFTRDELLAIMKNHIQTIMSRYKGQVYSWDVVNEPISDYPGLLKDNLWLKAIGPDYIKDALTYAKEADPNAKLYLNEYWAEGLNEKSNKMYTLTRQLKAQGAPLDGIGIQMHIDNINKVPNPQAVAANMARLNSLGLEVAISEMDVSLGTGNTNPTQEQLVKQAQIYEEMALVCKKAPNCKRFTVWGISDNYTWRKDINGRQPDPSLIFDDNYNPKPAFTSLQKVFGL